MKKIIRKITLNLAVMELIEEALHYQTEGIKRKEDLNYFYMTRLSVPEIVEQIDDFINSGDYTIKGWEQFTNKEQEEIVCTIAVHNGFNVFKDNYPVDFNGSKVVHYTKGHLAILAIAEGFKDYCLHK